MPDTPLKVHARFLRFHHLLSFHMNREDSSDCGGLRSLRSLRTLPLSSASSLRDNLLPTCPSRYTCPRVDTPPQSLLSPLSKIGTPLYGRRPPRQTYPTTTVIIYKAKGDDLISHPLFKYDVESILLLVNALVVCTLRTSLATLERTLSTWLCTLSCLSHVL